MNANELADCLNKMATILYNRGRIPTGSDYNLMYKAETMLRQLQAENEALKAEIVSIEKNTDYWSDKGNWIRNNEPVAYWDGKEPNVLGLAYHQNDYCFIPLYTHPVKELRQIKGINYYVDAPVKELTDEEIYKIAMEVQTGFFPQDDTLDFARAILRKAQER